MASPCNASAIGIRTQQLNPANAGLCHPFFLTLSYHLCPQVPGRINPRRPNNFPAGAESEVRSAWNAVMNRADGLSSDLGLDVTFLPSGEKRSKGFPDFIVARWVYFARS